MTEGSPYRARGRRKTAEKIVAFHHRRFALGVAIAAVAGLAALGFVRLPRTVTVTCAGLAGPVLECSSESQFFFGRTRHFRSEVHPPIAPGLPAAFQPQASLEDLRLFTESRSRHLGLEMALFASIGSGQGSRLTPWFPDADEPAFADLDVYQRILARGAKVPIEYRTAWAGYELTLIVWFGALMLLWLLSGDSRVVIDSDEERVTCETRQRWLSPIERREFSRPEIADVVVTASGDDKARMYRPALLLKNGEEFVLGATGPATPTRAAYFVTELRRALELEHDPRAEAQSG